MVGALQGIGAGLQDFAKTFLALHQNQLERQRQARLDAQQAEVIKAQLAGEDLTNKVRSEELADLPNKRAGEDADRLATALGPEGKFGSQEWLAASARAGAPIPTRTPLLPSRNAANPNEDFSTDESVDPTTHAVLPPEVQAAREGRNLAVSKDKLIMRYLSGAANGNGLNTKDPSTSDRIMGHFAGLPDSIFPPVSGVPVNAVKTTGAQGGPNAGKPVIAGVDRSGNTQWERPDEGGQENAITDIAPDIQVTARGGRYVDLSKYTGTGKNQALKLAHTAGAIPVDATEADSLRNVDTARRNTAEMFQTIKSKLPTDPQGRVTGFMNRTLSQVLQTDADRGAYQGWIQTVIPTLRAISGKLPRLNSVELQAALAANPTLNDTVPVAAQKMKIINAAIDNVEHSILGSYEKQPGVTAAAAPAGKTATAADINAYARARGVSAADAANQLKANGYTIEPR